MKNYKQFISGIIVGGVLLSGGNALANNASLPSITNWVKYKINGEEKQLPSGYTTLRYEGHTYVPTRFIAEELGAEVDWNPVTETVEIEQQKLTEQEQTEEQQPNDTTNDNDLSNDKEEVSQNPVVDYDELPTSKSLNGVSVEIYNVDQSDYEYTKIYFRVKNTKNAPMQFLQATAYLEAEGKKYEHKSASSAGLQWKDTTWFTDLKEDDDNEGYVLIPKVPNDVKKGKVHVEVLQNDRVQEVTNYDFNISWK